MNVSSNQKMQSSFVRISYIFFLTIFLVNAVYSKSADKGQLFLGKYPIPNNTPDPININTKKVHHENLPPILVIGIINALTMLSNSGKSVQTKLLQPFTFAQASGGVLGKDVYQFSEIQYLWTDDVDGTATISIDGKGSPVTFCTVFRNRKYSSTKEASKHRDGFAIFLFSLNICSTPTPNKLFDPLGKKMKRIQEPGSSTVVFLGTSIKAIDYALPNTTYYAYPGSYIDGVTGKQYSSATVIVVPPSPISCVTEEQFENSFGSLKNISGGRLTHILPQHPAERPVIQASGIFQPIFVGF